MRASKEAPPSAFFHASNLLLYFDEPNMGLELDPRCVWVSLKYLQASLKYLRTVL
jgi:preprotein translocase subunit Sec61beta